MIRGGKYEGVAFDAFQISEGAIDSVFVNCTFTGTLKSVKFVNCIFTDCGIEQASWDRVDLSTCRIDGLHLTYFKMKRILFPDGMEPSFGDTVTKRAYAISKGSKGIKRVRSA